MRALFCLSYSAEMCIRDRDEGRKYFLLYLRPIINGTGNYYIETQTREQKRTDIIVDYLGEQYIICLLYTSRCV